MDLDEEFVPVPGFESYLISKSGIIASLLSHRIMTQSVNVQHGGYTQVAINLWKEDGKRYFCTVSRLVAQAFIPNPDNLLTVDHIDRNRL